MSETQNQTASLGCGTLILIAVIVSIFGNSRGDLEREVRGLREDVKALSKEVHDLRDSLKDDE